MDDAADNFAPEEARTLGSIFAGERERQGLSRADVAQRLHMSPSQVEAVEADDFERLPKGTFLRGFVRNYAKLLGLEPDPLLDMLADAAPPAPAPRIVVPTQNIRFDPLGERLSSPYVKAATLAVVAVAIAFAAMYWAMYVRPQLPSVLMHRVAPPATRPAQPQPGPVMPQPEPAPPVSGAPQPAAPRPGAPGAPVAPPSGVAQPGESASAAPQPAADSTAGAKRAAPAAQLAPGDADAEPAASKGPAPPGAKRMRFHFVGDSWVEVRDAEGKVVFQRLNPAGSDAQVTARPPLQVVVGNAPEVEMTWEGKPFDLAPHTNVAVARFTLE